MSSSRRKAQPTQAPKAAEPTILGKIFKQIPAFATGALAVAAIIIPIWQSDLQRVGAMRLSDYQAIVSEQKVFYGLLNSFTLQLSRGEPADEQKAEALGASIVQQYANIQAFMVNVDAAREQPFRDYQTALNNVKNGLFRVHDIKDLEQFGAELVELQRKLKIVEPIMQEIAGKGVGASAAVREG